MVSDQTPANARSSPRADGQQSSVLVLSPIYPWPGMPPEGIFVHRQIQNLVQLGHRVRVINYHPAIPGLPRSLVGASWLRYHPRSLYWPGSLDGVRVEHVFYPQPRGNRGDAVPRIADAVTRHLDRHPGEFQPDVVYAHWLWTGGAVALALRERIGRPVAAIARGSDLHRWQTVHRYCRDYVQQVIERADLVLANCDFLRSRAAAMAPSVGAAIRIAYNGCDTTLFRPAEQRDEVRRALGFSSELRYFLCCATVAEHKGVGDLAAAWEQFAPRNPTWRLVVLGPVAQRASARALRRLTSMRVELRGQRGAHEVPRYLQAADAYIQPSRLEGLSNATMEAMSTALPVVTTDAGSQHELIDGTTNGWIVPAAHPDLLAAAMDAVANDPAEALIRGAAARQTIVTRFDARSEAGRLSVLLTTLARGERPLLASAVPTPSRSPDREHATTHR